MNIRDYLIDHSAFDWAKLSETWQWRLPHTLTPWLVNCFGDLIFRTDDGKVHRLLLDDGSLECLADSKDHFIELVDQADNANDWLAIPLVDRLRTSGKVIGPDECYAFIQLPLAGGSYGIENIKVRKIAFQYAALGPIFEKLEKLPEGTQIEFQISD